VSWFNEAVDFPSTNAECRSSSGGSIPSDSLSASQLVLGG
jgi:hypothetical protein